jgi:dCTP deaminase
MILSGPEIHRQVDKGLIEIDPYDIKQLNPASYDLTLGTGYHEIHNDYNRVFDIADPSQYESTRKTIDGSIVLMPDVGYLMHTVERIHTDSLVAVVDGKSSLGRLFMQVHMTAGYIDPGFNGQITLEVRTMMPIRIYAGMRIAQVRFHVMHGGTELIIMKDGVLQHRRSMLYSGNYIGEHAMGAQPSHAWRMFTKQK